jgi:hypothetical protein
MNGSWIRAALLISVLAGAGLDAGCGGSGPDGTYQNTGGAVSLELKGGKAALNEGSVRIDGTYTVNGDKITMRPTVGDTNQAMVFTVNKDGSIDGPPGSDITKLQKAK